MNLIQNITNDAYQTQTLILESGQAVDVTMRFVPLQYGWFITEISYGTFTLTGLRICVSPNMLRQFKNQIPFGLACYANSASREPTQQQDFSSGAFSLYILTQAEVFEYEEILAGNTGA